MNGNMIWDPLRKKEVPLTPEERVRQWFITMLRDTMHVPAHMMMSEVGLKYGAGTVKKNTALTSWSTTENSTRR